VNENWSMTNSAKKEQTRARILAGAGRSFRSHGYDGSGVDGVAKAAGVTSGAFYANFKSKADAFRETVVAGMQELENAIRNLRAQSESTWLEQFVDFYLGEKRTCALTESCALQSLTGEVARADSETRAAYEARLRGVIDAAAKGIDAASAKARRNEAIVMLALLSGGVSLARAVKDPAFSEEIALAIRGALKAATRDTRDKRTRANDG
jgi:TetR/AcrR family transcriptional regulator, transcriptional repressor for nem operon